MKKKSKLEIGEPAYKKWVTILSAAVAIGSLLLNIWLGVSNLKLQQEKAVFEKNINEIKLENERLDQLVRLRKMSVDLESRYFVVSGLALLKINSFDPGNPSGQRAMVQNKVLDDLGIWLEAWSSGQSPVSDANGVMTAHGVVLYRIFNRGEQDAQQVTLTIKWKDFSNEGDSAESIWELQTDGWQETTVRLADLVPGQNVIVPLAHILGTSTYFGRVIVPVKVEWYNPTLKQKESFESQGMAPEDQWISSGLNISVGQ